MSDQDKIDSLDRSVEHCLGLMGAMADQIAALTTRSLALTLLLEARGILPPGSVLAKMQELELSTIADIELGPEFEEYRRLRQQIRDMLKGE